MNMNIEDQIRTANDEVVEGYVPAVFSLFRNIGDVLAEQRSKLYGFLFAFDNEVDAKVLSDQLDKLKVEGKEIYIPMRLVPFVNLTKVLMEMEKLPYGVLLVFKKKDDAQDFSPAVANLVTTITLSKRMLV
jgi:hypothetical protein